MQVVPARACLMEMEADVHCPHPGKHAEVLNQVINELLEGHAVAKIKLKEVLGHTPLQVRVHLIAAGHNLS
jgi:acid phosphatase family membrane protein YuiD